MARTPIIAECLLLTTLPNAVDIIVRLAGAVWDAFRASDNAGRAPALRNRVSILTCCSEAKGLDTKHMERKAKSRPSQSCNAAPPNVTSHFFTMILL